MFIDIHSHNQVASGFNIYNVVYGKDEVPESKLHSIGIHPWYSSKWEGLLPDMEKVIKELNPNLIFIGECGLDKVKGLDMNEQEELFTSHVRLSEEYQKPLIIHCVKAYNELIQIKKKIKPNQSWIIHGFNRKKSIAKALLDEDLYLSMGINYLKTEIGRSVLQDIPLSRVFFETDDNIDVLIEEVYILASEILEISVSTLTKKIEENLCRVTGWKELNY